MKRELAPANESKPYDSLTFIQEDPTAPNQRKKPRTLTACDRCRTRKVKCETNLSKDKCDACYLANKECAFKARDLRFHNPENTQSIGLAHSSQPENTKDVSQTDNQSATYGHSTSPSPPIQSPASRFGSFNVLKRSASAIDRNSPDAVDPDVKPPNVPAMNRAIRPLNRTPTSPTRQVPGVTSPHSPPLSPANPQALVFLFDYPVHPTFPRRDHLSVLIPIFFEHFGIFFPFLRQADISQRAAAGRLWNIHALGIAALACRYSPLPVHTPEPRYQYSSTYLDVAKPLTTQYKGQLSLQALQGLVMLSWAECGSLLEQGQGGLWSPLASGSPSVYISETVRVAKALNIGSTANINSFGVSKEEVLATYFSVLLIDELVAWSNHQAPLFDERESNHQLESLGIFRNTFFLQLSALSLQRRKLGRTLHTNPTSVEERNAAVTAMRVVYDNIRKANPSLEFQQGNFQRSLQAGQGGSFAAFHSMYYSTTLRYRLTTMTSPSFQQIRDHDAAIVSAKNIIQLVNWCKLENRFQIVTDNLFLDSPLFDAAQILQASHQAMMSNFSGFPGYYDEIYECLDTLTTMGRVWAKTQAKADFIRQSVEPQFDVSSSLTPTMTAMNVASSPQALSNRSYYPPSAMMPASSSLPYGGWSHSPGSSTYPNLTASSAMAGNYYNTQGYDPAGRSQPRSSSPSSHRAIPQYPQYPHDPSWLYQQ